MAGPYTPTSLYTLLFFFKYLLLSFPFNPPSQPMGFLTFFTCLPLSDKVADCGTEEADCGTEDAAGVKNFRWQDIKKRTNNFSTVIGSGGFSTVYLARLPGSGPAAAKVQPACTDRLARIHHDELQILLRLKHPNIVKLIGRSEDGEQDRILLFEYAVNGTLHDKLHAIATWKTRTLIAFQLARALDYLHGVQIIHGDIKSSNILLDQHYNCKLCDFGSARSAFTSMVLPTRKMVIGSEGYLDPDYLKTGLVSKKNDVYSYGVVLLELVTGRAACGLNKAEILGAPVAEVVDPRLRYGGAGVDMEEVEAMVSLAGMCIGCSPMVRPSATEIVAFIKNKFPSINCS